MITVGNEILLSSDRKSVSVNMRCRSSNTRNEHLSTMFVHHCIVSAETGFIRALKKRRCSNGDLARTVLAQSRANFPQKAAVHSIWVVRGLHNQGQIGSNHGDPGDAARPMPRQIAD